MQEKSSIIKEVPILMSTPMVIALLDGTKTETRRDKNLKEINENPREWTCNHKKINKNGVFYTLYNVLNEEVKTIKQPWQKGNILWCKETWKPSLSVGFAPDSSQSVILFKADGERVQVPKEEEEWFKELTKNGRFTYKSSMFMRRKFARIFLEVTNVSLERLHSITPLQCINEGIESKMGNRTDLYRNYMAKDEWTADAVLSYKSLWEKINGIGSWKSNPWIWRIEFTKLNNYKKQ